MRKVTEDHHWGPIHRHRRIIRMAAIMLKPVITAINFEALFAVLHALLYGAKGATGHDLPPINRTSYFFKRSINLENVGHENKQI